MQQAVGNRALCQMLGVQARLAVGPSDDPAEQEADAGARQVLSAISASTAGRPSAAPTPPPIRRRPAPAPPVGPAGGPVAESTARSIESERPAGTPLAPDARRRLEPAFGADLGHIRVHEGARSTALNAALGAEAFTVGNDVFFRDGVPDTSSSAGQELLAHEVVHTFQQGGAGPAVARRRNSATPANFRATGTSQDDVTCTVRSNHTWTSSTNDLGDLSDVLQREKVVFDSDPRTDMPAYNHPPPGIQINGAELIKTAGPMSSGGATDTHSGAAETTAFNYGPRPNLRKAAWTLVGRQHYQYRDGGGTWVDLHVNPYVITRKMEQDAQGQWHLTITKTGPGVNVTAGPTPIYDQVSTVAMSDIAGQRVDQTAEWQAELNNLQALGLGLKKDTTETITTPAKKKVTVVYEYTDPVAKPALDDKAAYKMSSSVRKQVRAEAKGAVKAVKAVLDGANPPARIVFTLAHNTGALRQQAWWTNESGGTYRVLLRADKLTNLRDHIPSSVPGSAATAAAGTKTKDKDKDKARICAYARGSAVHELGHMLHAKASPDKFLSAAMVAPLPPDTGGDPLRPQKEQIASINSRVMAALLQSYLSQNWAPKWGYALQNSNPAEVVAEVFTALMAATTTNVTAAVPRGLAATYLAYGGYQGGDLAAKLSVIFAGAVPALAQPQDCLQYMA